MIQINPNVWKDFTDKQTRSGVKIVSCYILDAPEIIKSTEEEIVLVTWGTDFGIDTCTLNTVHKSGEKNLKFVPGKTKYQIATRNHVYHLYDDIPKNIKMWYGVHGNIKHERFSCLPEGVFYDIMSFKKNVIPKNYLYLNCINSNGRNFVIETFKNCDHATVFVKTKKNKLTMDKYTQQLQEHKFCISPQGNGYDTYRFWESLYLGVIPIVKRRPLVEHFIDLPILIVDSWDEALSKKFLDDSYERIRSTSYTLEKLDFNYWKEKIKSI